MVSTPPPVVRLISFGFLHLPKAPSGQLILPKADRIEDVRDSLRDPAVAREIIDLDGFDPRVRQVVLNTPGARDLLDDLAAYAMLPAIGSRTIAIGCAGGKHRACALVILLYRDLWSRGFQVRAEHLHAHLPRVLRAS